MPALLARRLLDLHQLGLLGAETVPHGELNGIGGPVYSPTIGIFGVYLSLEAGATARKMLSSLRFGYKKASPLLRSPRAGA
jgi:hypothetical protein